jgi:glucose-6-phosphate isomerase
MKGADFSFKNAGISTHNIHAAAPILSGVVSHLVKIKDKGYGDWSSSINLPSDNAMHSQVKKLSKKYSKATLIVVVGIGGSNLGTMAVYDAIKGKYASFYEDKMVLFADTVDSDSLDHFCSAMKEHAEGGFKTLLCFVTKSGGTTETVANFEVLYQTLKKHQKGDEWVVAITDKGSKLWDLAAQKRWDTLEIPKYVGGRYSVFSPVGLFPLAVAGIHIDSLLKGAKNMRNECLEENISKNPAALSAITIATHYRHHHKNIHDTFLFANDLENIGKWYRQLMGESIGKEHDLEGKKVNRGITPTVSIGSTDLHSMAQLYLGGPHDKFTTFITLKSFNTNLKVPNMKEYDALVPSIQGKSMAQLMGAIEKGVKTAFAKDKRPFIEVILAEKSEEAVGALLQFKMMEMIFLGKLLNVNPFDQPNVEDYKIVTKQILEGKQGRAR